MGMLFWNWPWIGCWISYIVVRSKAVCFLGPNLVTLLFIRSFVSDKKFFYIFKLSAIEQTCAPDTCNRLDRVYFFYQTCFHMDTKTTTSLSKKSIKVREIREDETLWKCPILYNNGIQKNRQTFDSHAQNKPQCLYFYIK